MKLSIIIPTLGRPTLQQVLKGIEECKHFELIRPEVLVVFDGAMKLIKSLHNRFPYVRFLKNNNTTGGSSAARNVGMDHATGDVIAFIGDDTVPTKLWLTRVTEFHEKYPQASIGLLGKVSWPPQLAKDPFHAWLEDNAQFTFEQIRRHGANWRHFYASNVSVKRRFIKDKRFSPKFLGWGFEDAELGYRLEKEGLRLSFDESCEVLHNHRQTLEGLCKNFRSARKNARVFERLHPEVKLLPRGGKRVALKCLIGLSRLSPKFLSPRTYWWREWKKAWLGGDSEQGGKREHKKWGRRKKLNMVSKEERFQNLRIEDF